MKAAGAVELSPARPALAAAGRIGLAIDLIAALIALLVIRPAVTTVSLLIANAVVSGAVSLVVCRRGLRRVAAPIPAGAIVVPARFPTGRLLASLLVNATLAFLSIVGFVSPAALGPGIGAEIGVLWSASKIRAFERDDGRQVVRAVRRRTGAPALYAAG